MAFSDNPNESDHTTPHQRHRMLTIFAMITALNALPQAYYTSSPVFKNEGGGSPIGIFFFMVILGVYGATAWGLWNMKNWSRYMLVGIIVVTFISQLFSLNILLLMISFALRAVIVYWFVTNGQYFEGGEEPLEDFGSAESFPGDDDEPVLQDNPTNRNRIAGYVAMIAVVLVGIVIAMRILIPKESPAPQHVQPTVPFGTKVPTKTITPPFAYRNLGFDMAGKNLNFPDSGLRYPMNIAVDGQGNVYVNGQSENWISIFDAKGEFSQKWDARQVCKSPLKLGNEAIDSASHLYVTCGWIILKYDITSGGLLAQFDAKDISSNSFYESIAINPDGNLLIIIDAPEAGVYEAIALLDAKDGTILRRVDSPISSLTHSSVTASKLKPAVDSQGNLYILDNTDGIIYKFDRDWKYVTKFSDPNIETRINNTVLGYPAYRMVIDSMDRIITADFSSIVVFNPDGEIIDEYNADFAWRIFDMYLANGQLYILGNLDEAGIDGNGRIFRLKLN